MFVAMFANALLTAIAGGLVVLATIAPWPALTALAVALVAGVEGGVIVLVAVVAPRLFASLSVKGERGRQVFSRALHG